MSAAQGDGKSVEKSDVVGKDILSILVRANMAADLAPNQRLSDPEVMAQISTFVRDPFYQTWNRPPLVALQTDFGCLDAGGKRNVFNSTYMDAIRSFPTP